MGDRPGVDLELETLNRMAEELRQPAQRWYTAAAETALALMEGHFDGAERQIAATLAAGRLAQSWNATVSERIALFMLRRAEGRLAEVEDAIGRSVREYPALFRFRCAYAHLLADIGREREARAAFDEVLSRDLAREHLDAEWLFGMNLLPDVCARLRDERAAARLYELLTPHAGRYAHAPLEASAGSIERGLGVLAVVLRNYDDAERHFEGAIELERQMGARPWLAHARHDLAAMLLAQGGAAGRERADAHLDEALSAYRDLGMQAWYGRAAALAEGRKPRG
jgi:tetratricopeptide (TPR) repeat protein